MNTIPQHESLICEFKSDRQCLPDKDLIEAVVCMANAQGGEIYLGVEDDGTVTGLHTNHQHLDSLAALIANRTQPAITAMVESLLVNALQIARITVPKSANPVATNDGVLKRRRLQANGKPECVPYLPHEFSARLASFSLLDMSAKAIAGAKLTDFDPIERARLRHLLNDSMAIVRCLSLMTRNWMQL